jgi:uncharacterized damage-inducible protein DinB
MNEPLAEMFRYNRWASLTLIEACRPLTDEQLDTRGQGTSGTVRELLMHMVGAQQAFVQRTQGRQSAGGLSRNSAWPGFDLLLDAARESGEELIGVAERLEQDSDVDLAYMGRVFSFPASFFLVHAAEHGVEHRTEIKVALAQLGIDTPDLDGWPFAGAMGYGREARAT